MRLPQIPNRRILTIYFLLGFGALIAQTVLLREFMVISYGNELCVGALLAAWLFWIAVGAEVGGWVSGRTRRPSELFAGWMLFAALALPVQVSALRYARIVLGIPEGEYIPFLIGALYGAIAISPFSFVIGTTFPLGIRLLSDEASRESSSVGRLWAVEACGSLCGGLVFTFLLVGWLSPLWCVAVVMLAQLAACALVRPLRNTHVIIRGVGGIVLLVAILSGQIERKTLAARWKSFGTYSRLIRSLDSKYQNIVVSKRAEQYNLFCDGHYSTSFPDDYVPIVTAKMAFAQHAGAGRALVIGGGLEGLLKHVLDMKVTELDYVQLDPQIIATIRPLLANEDRKALDKRSVRVLPTDGRRFVKTTDKRYDLIFVNLPDPSTAMLNRYYTVDFFREVKRILRHDGVFVFCLAGDPDYVGEQLADYAGSVYFSLIKVFPFVFVCPQERSFFYATQQEGLLSGDADELYKRRSRFDPPHEIVSSVIIKSMFLPGRFDLLRARLKKQKGLALNTDLHPSAYFYYMLYTDKLTNFRLSRWLQERAALKVLSPPVRWLERLSSRWSSRVRHLHPRSVYLALILIAVLGLIPLAGSRPLARRFRKSALLYVTLASGFGAMTLEIVLLLAFQCSFGYLYHVIGLLVAMFMAGLAVGSGLTSRVVDRGRSLLRYQVGLQTALIVFAAALPGLAGAAASFMPIAGVAFTVLIAIAGGLTGALLPLTAALIHRQGFEITRVAGHVDRADHLGACLGALLCVTLLVPIFGVTQTCLIVAALNAVGLVWVAANSLPTG